jgi:hypothetical protein
VPSTVPMMMRPVEPLPVRERDFPYESHWLDNSVSGEWTGVTAPLFHIHRTKNV